MTNRTRSVAIVVAMAAITMGASAPKAVEKPRPFSATVETWSTVEATPDPCVLLNDGAGAGIAVHMGATAWVSSGSLNVCTGGTTAEFVMTAASGDEVFGKYMSLVRPDFEAGVFTFSGTWKIEGGTGRFSNAAGEGTLNGWGNLVQPPEASRVRATIAGNLSY